MKGREGQLILIKSPLLTNYLKKIDHFLCTTGTFKVQLLQCRCLFKVFLQVSRKMFFILTNITYNLRSRNELYCRNPKLVKYGKETISASAPKIWSLVRKPLDAFKSKIRQWEPTCSCCLYRTYLQLVSFIQFLIKYLSKTTINLM